MAVTGVGYSLAVVGLFSCMISEKPMQLRSPNVTYKMFHDESLKPIHFGVRWSKVMFTRHNKTRLLVFRQNTTLPLAAYLSHTEFTSVQCRSAQAMLATLGFLCHIPTSTCCCTLGFPLHVFLHCCDCRLLLVSPHNIDAEGLISYRCGFYSLFFFDAQSLRSQNGYQ